MYTPQKNGFAQTSYSDQQGTALAGAMAFVSDVSLVNSYAVAEDQDETNGIEAGLIVSIEFVDTNFRAGINNQVIKAFSDAAEKVGVTVRNQQMSSNPAGNACWYPGSMANVLDTARVGGRVWCQLVEGETPVAGGEVYAVTTASAGKAVGQLVTAAGADAVAVVGAKFISVDEGGLVLVEFDA